MPIITASLVIKIALTITCGYNVLHSTSRFNAIHSLYRNLRTAYNTPVDFDGNKFKLVPENNKYNLYVNDILMKSSEDVERMHLDVHSDEGLAHLMSMLSFGILGGYLLYLITEDIDSKL